MMLFTSYVSLILIVNVICLLPNL